MFHCSPLSFNEIFVTDKKMENLRKSAMPLTKTYALVESPTPTCLKNEEDVPFIILKNNSIAYTGLGLPLAIHSL